MEVPSIFLDRILVEAAKNGSYDIHLSVGNQPVMRIDGSLQPLDKEEIITKESIGKIIDSFVSEEERQKLKKNKELTVVKTFANDLRFRISIFYQRNLPSLSFNYIPGIIRSLEELGLPENVKKLINLESGLLIVAGPNNSGKTSTANSLLEEINKNFKKYVITLEDPIEYLFINKKSIVEQRQVGQDVNTYVEGLEHCLSEDVDVVYIDEMNHEFSQAMPYVLELASGNSFVILEMNAENSIRTLEKILNNIDKKGSSEAIRYNLADVLVGIISQKLVPKRGGGQTLAIEIMMVNSPVKSLIREGKIYQLESIIQTSKDEGMISMDRSIEELMREGKIKEEGLRGDF